MSSFHDRQLANAGLRYGHAIVTYNKACRAFDKACIPYKNNHAMDESHFAVLGNPFVATYDAAFTAFMKEQRVYYGYLDGEKRRKESQSLTWGPKNHRVSQWN